MSEAYLRGVQLFETGYYWEAHEVWEGLWHAHGRSGPTADALKALIKLAAAGVKVLQGQRHGVVIHASRASALFDRVSFDVGKTLLGLDLDELAKITRGLAENPPVPEPDFSGSPQKVFTFSLKPTHTHPTNKAEE